MPASFTLLLLGEPDRAGVLIYALIFLSCQGGFVLTVALIYLKVFRGDADITTIDREGAGGGADG